MPPSRRRSRSTSRRTNLTPAQLRAIVNPPHSKLISSRKNAVFGQSKTANYKYVEQVSISSGVNCGVQTFRLNSMFDPNFTGIGHQPLFRDVMSGIFARYRVNYVQFKITPMSRNANQFCFAVLATQDSGYNPASTTLADNLEKRNVKWRFQSVNTPPAIIRGKIKCHEVAGVSKQAYKDERNYSGAIGNNPTLDLYLSLLSQDSGGASITQDFMVELLYNTTYYEPFIQPQS